MNTAADVIAKARSQIGYSRWADPSHGTKYGRWYAQYTGVPYYGQDGVPYCAMFTSWCFNQVGAQCVGLPAAYCPYIVRDARAAGKTVSARSAKPGDVILFDWEGDGVADHVGICESNTGSYLVCIEGNTDNGVVARKNRPYSTVCCVVRPSYSAGIGAPGIIQAAPNMTDSQLWRVVAASEGFCTIECKSGKVLDVKGGKTAPIANGRYVQAYKPNWTDAQLWKMEEMGEGFRIVPKLDDSFCLDVKNGAVNTRKNILLHTKQADKKNQWAQVFYLMPYYGDTEWNTIVNAKSGWALDANPSGYDYP